MDIEEIIARSRSPGRFVERRQFTLSQSKAIEKLREFSLRHPQQYILELMQAAVFAGATYVAVDVDHDSLLVAWSGGQALTAHQLENIFQYLFVDQLSAETRHLRQIAVSLNVLLQRQPRQIRIESGDGTVDGTIRMDLQGVEKGVVGTTGDSISGTYIYVRYNRGWLSRFTAAPIQPEEEMIETRCRQMPIPVLLNARLPFGATGNEPSRLERFDDQGRRGSFQVRLRSHQDADDDGPRAAFKIVMGGIRICTINIEEFEDPSLVVSGSLYDDNLRKTADHSDIVRDHRYDALLHAALPALTRTIRKKRPGYQPPRLPPVVAPRNNPNQAPAEEVALEPLPDPIPQLEPRPPLPIAALQKIPPGAPLFVVRSDLADDVKALADPARLYWPVLVLREGQIHTLTEQGVRFAPLTGPNDVAFVRRALERRNVQRQISVPCMGGSLILNLRQSGDQPGWGFSQGVPLLIADKDKTRWCGQLPVHLPDISLALHRDEEMMVDEGVLEMIASTARGALGNLLFQEQHDPAGAAFRCAALAVGLVPLFVEQDDDTVALDASLPPDWDASLRTLPLDAGVSLDRLLSAINAGETIALPDNATRKRFAPIEARLGFGHLTVAEDEHRPVLLLERRRDHWVETTPDQPQTQPRVWLRPSLHPQKMSTVGAVAGAPPEVLREGLIELHRVLLGLEREGWDRVARRSRYTRERCQEMGQLGLLELDVRLNRHAPVLLDAAGETLTTAALDERMVSPRHGPRGVPPETLLLRFDQVRCLLHFGFTVQLRFDDPPEVWASLAEPHAEGWLARLPVVAPGLRGWLGLRAPFDATGGVFVYTPNATYALLHDEADPVCHGLLILDGDQPPTIAHAEAVRLTRRRLYQQIAGTDGEDAKKYQTHRETRQRRPVHANTEPIAQIRDRLRQTLPPELQRRFVFGFSPEHSRWQRFQTHVNQQLAEHRRWQMMQKMWTPRYKLLVDTQAEEENERNGFGQLPVSRQLIEIMNANDDPSLWDILSNANNQSRFDDRGVHQQKAEDEQAMPLEIAGVTRAGGPFLRINPEHPLIRQALREPDGYAAELLLIEASRLLCAWFTSLDYSQRIMILTSQRLR